VISHQLSNKNDGCDRATRAVDHIPRYQERGESRPVDRINLAVHATPPVVRAQLTGIEATVISPRVIVLDLQIAVEDETLGNDEIVRLVARESDEGDRSQPQHDVNRE